MTAPNLPNAPKDHAGCADWLKAGFARLGADVIVTTAPPLVLTRYDQDPFVCPHGVTFWHAPTSEQIAQWARDGVA